ncbi:MAG: DUF2231 domain-containing protein [Thermoleophilia bacterium]
MEIGSFMGLPAHPLLVHLPVVLIPLTALVALGAVFWAPHRLLLSRVTVVMAFVGLVGAVLAAGSGEAFAQGLTDVNRQLVHDHQEFGEQLRFASFLFFLAAAAFALHMRARSRTAATEGPAPGLLASPLAFRGTAVALLLTAALATTWTALAGHSGAKAAWKGRWSSSSESTTGRAPTTPATASAAGIRPYGDPGAPRVPPTRGATTHTARGVRARARGSAACVRAAGCSAGPRVCRSPAPGRRP